jgi:UV DNA damage repair endonuclease
VQQHAALVVGNLAQSDPLREALGSAGAVEALMLICDSNTTTTTATTAATANAGTVASVGTVAKANALWALSNLAWCPSNQLRVGRYAAVLLQMVAAEDIETGPCRVHAMACLANALYYHEVGCHSTFIPIFMQ